MVLTDLYATTEFVVEGEMSVIWWGGGVTKNPTPSSLLPELTQTTFDREVGKQTPVQQY